MSGGIGQKTKMASEVRNEKKGKWVIAVKASLVKNLKSENVGL